MHRRNETALRLSLRLARLAFPQDYRGAVLSAIDVPC